MKAPKDVRGRRELLRLDPDHSTQRADRSNTLLLSLGLFQRSAISSYLHLSLFLLLSLTACAAQVGDSGPAGLEKQLESNLPYCPPEDAVLQEGSWCGDVLNLWSITAIYDEAFAPAGATLAPDVNTADAQRLSAPPTIACRARQAESGKASVFQCAPSTRRWVQAPYTFRPCGDTAPKPSDTSLLESCPPASLAGMIFDGGYCGAQRKAAELDQKLRVLDSPPPRLQNEPPISLNCRAEDAVTRQYSNGVSHKEAANCICGTNDLWFCGS